MNKVASVICSTYNAPLYLRRVLFSYARQSNKNFEFIVADDGSGEETRALIEEFQKTFPVPLKHVWHEDHGYQKAKIHNEAIRQSEGELLIFTDGDCVADPYYVDDHLKIFEAHKRDPYVFMGRRVEVGPKLTEKIFKVEDPFTYLGSWSVSLFKSCLQKDSRNFMRSFRIENPIVRRLIGSHKVPDVLGCNFSVRKEDMLAINGFNEDFQSYWGEDGDIFIRLRNRGAKLIGMKSYAVQYHLYHPRLQNTKEHEEYYYSKLNDWDYKWAPHGLTQ